MWCENDCHCDRIAFDSSVFAHMLAKLDSFFTMWRYIGRKPANHHGLVVSVTFSEISLSHGHSNNCSQAFCFQRGHLFGFI